MRAPLPKLVAGCLLQLLLGCSPPDAGTLAEVQTGNAAGGAALQHMRLAYGGRLFDMWYDESTTTFAPDDPATPEADGRGGPNGNGTLNNAAGEPVANNGHDYRLKNLFGWDMRGAAGIYGTDYQNKPFVLAEGPLSPALAGLNRDAWIRRITAGTDAQPAFGSVLSEAEISALVDYMLGVRDRTLPHPDDLYELSTVAPQGFVLRPGGNALLGQRFYAARCAECHGEDGTAVLFDGGEQSLGQHARYYGYAIAMITLAGEPGSTMGPQLAAGLSTAQQTQRLLDLLAALCDRQRYPSGGATDPDVPDGDARCGAYLR